MPNFAMPKWRPFREKAKPTLGWPATSTAPPQSCANCGFLRKYVADRNGNNNYSFQSVDLVERAAGFNQHIPPVSNNWLAFPQCIVRARHLEVEASEASVRGSSTDPIATLAVLRKDRRRSSPDYCPGFYPFMEHLDLQQHWEERQMFRLEETRLEFEREDRRRDRWIQALILVAAMATIMVNVAITNCGNQEATLKLSPNTALPVVVTTPTTGSLVPSR